MAYLHQFIVTLQLLLRQGIMSRLARRDIPKLAHQIKAVQNLPQHSMVVRVLLQLGTRGGLEAGVVLQSQQRWKAPCISSFGEALHKLSEEIVLTSHAPHQFRQPQRQGCSDPGAPTVTPPHDGMAHTAGPCFNDPFHNGYQRKLAHFHLQIWELTQGRAGQKKH